LIPDAREEECGDKEGGGINEHGDWCAEQINQESAEPWPEESSGGTTELKLAVSFDKIVASDQRGKVCLVCHVEEDGEDSDQKPNSDELGECQNTSEVGEWDCQDQDGATEIATDQHCASRETIHQRASEQADQQEGEEVGEVEDRHLEWSRLQERDRNNGERDPRNARAEVTDRLCRPESEESRVTTQRLA
jgi:hypothetical protein